MIEWSGHHPLDLSIVLITILLVVFATIFVAYMRSVDVSDSVPVVPQVGPLSPGSQDSPQD